MDGEDVMFCFLQTKMLLVIAYWFALSSPQLYFWLGVI